MDLSAFDWAGGGGHRYGGIPAAQEAAATPLTRTMLDLCSSDMEFPFAVNLSTCGPCRGGKIFSTMKSVGRLRGLPYGPVPAWPAKHLT